MTSILRNDSISRFLRAGLMALYMALCAIMLAACGGGSGTLGITTGITFFTTAPGSVTINSGAATYTIGGGTPTYSASSSNKSVATASVSGTSLTITSVAPGTTTVLVSDAAGHSLTINVTIGNGGVPTSLFTSAPDEVTVAVGATTSYTISGGSPAYSISSSNPAIARTGINGSTFTISGVASGTATVLVRDTAGASVTIAVTIGSGRAPTLFTTAPSAITLAIGVTTPYTVSGGSTPYSVGSSNLSVATVGISGSSFIISGVSAGSAQVSVFDSTGAVVTIAVTVSAGAVPPTPVPVDLFTTAPNAITFAPGTSATYNIGGGSAPYSASSSNASVASAQASGATLIINAGASGTAQIAVFDAAGKSVTIAVTVGSGGAPTPLFTTAPDMLTLGIGVTGTYTVNGGSPVYAASSSNPAVVTAGIKGTTLTITGVTQGSAQIIVRDATGTAVTISVTVGSVSVPTPLFTTAPDMLTLGVGVTTSYTVSGGSPGYTVSSSNPAVATTSVNGNTFIISGITPGAAQIVLRDTIGTSVTIAVTVPSGGTPTSPVPLFTTAPGTITIPVGGTPVSYTIGGGTGPYTASSSNPGVASAGVSGTSLSISGLTAGSAQIGVFDATGTSVTISVTVGSGSAPAPLFTTAQGAITIGVGGTPASFNIGGGTPPYSATSSNAAIASTPGGNITMLSISGVATGNARIAVFDSAGASVTIDVTVQGPGGSGGPPSISPTSITTGDCTTNIPFTITGGTPPFTVFTNESVAVPVSAAIPFGTNYVFTATVGPLGGTLITGATLTVLDSQSRTANATVSIMTSGLHLACPNDTVLQTVPASANAHVSQALNFQITGGLAPFTVTSGTPSVATVAMVTPTTFSAFGLAVGTSLLTVHSADGQNANVTLTVIP